MHQSNRYKAWLVVVAALIAATMACATLRSPDEPAPTQRPTIEVSPTPSPFLFGG